MTVTIPISFTVSGGAVGGPSFTYGTVPPDGYFEGGTSAGTSNTTALAVPQLEEGSRLSGTVTITPASSTPYAIPAGSLVRLLIDGVPAGPFVAVETASWAIDTTKIADGTHVFGVQFSTTPAAGAENGSRIYVVNNSSAPFTSPIGQAVIGAEFAEHSSRSLAWGRCNVLPPVSVPIPHSRADFPLPTPADASRLETGNLWWAQGLQHQPTQLYDTWPGLWKNRSGDCFFASVNPQSTDASATAAPAVQAWPAFDGPRGVCSLSPYATAVPGGLRDFVAVDLAGRIVDMGIDGSVTTWFGPRSVSGKMQSHPYHTDLGLAYRVAAGEKEYVGIGPFLSTPQDIVIETDDGDVVMVADIGTNEAVYLSRSQAKIIRTVSLPGITSVWCDATGQDWAVTPTGLYKINEDGTTALFAAIPNAFWVRGDDTRGLIYVLDTSVGLWSVDRNTGTATLRNTPGFAHSYVFMAVDADGTIGTQGNIYYAASASYNDNTYFSVIKPGEWIERGWFPQIYNRGNLYASRQATHDVFGHYLWGIAIHAVEAIWISVGFSQTSWKIGMAMLGSLPTLDADIDPTVFNRGAQLVGMVDRDRTIGLAELFGQEGAGGLGVTVDAFAGMTLAQAQAYLAPLLPASMAASDVTAVASYLWAQRSRPPFPS